jgi:ATP synthase protein I
VAHDPNDAPKGPVAEDPALDSLDARLSAARKAEDVRLAQEHVPVADARHMGFGVASTMLGYPLGGIIIGFALDQWLDTTPWITITLMFTAFVGALLQVGRINKDRK